MVMGMMKRIVPENEDFCTGGCVEPLYARQELVRLQMNFVVGGQWYQMQLGKALLLKIRNFVMHSRQIVAPPCRRYFANGKRSRTGRYRSDRDVQMCSKFEFNAG
jgi:hypothetical protein